MEEDGYIPSEKKVCEIRFWEGLSYTDPFTLKTKVENFSLKYYNLTTTMTPTEYLNVKLDCYKVKIEGLNPTPVKVDLDWCYLELKIVQDLQTYFDCIKNKANETLNVTHCDIIYPLEINLGYWDLNRTSYIQRNKYVAQIRARTYISYKDEFTF